MINKNQNIHLNLVSVGLVDKYEDWLYSSARNYITGIIEIDEV
jgi:hypothetical protein